MKHGKTSVTSVKYPDTSIQITAGVDIQPLTVKNVSGDYTLIQEDLNNKMIRVEVFIGNTATITFPEDQVGIFECPIGTRVIVSAAGLGEVILSPANNVTLLTPETLTIDRKYGRSNVFKVAANTWAIDGQLQPLTP